MVSRRLFENQVLRLKSMTGRSVFTLAVAAVLGFQGVTVQAEIVSINALAPPPKGSESVSLVNEDDVKLLEPANTAFLSGDRAEFDKQYKAALAKSDRLPALEVYLTKLLIESGRLSEAIQLVEIYLRDHPEDPEAYVALSEIALKSGRWTDAWLAIGNAERLVQQKKLPSARLAFVVPGLVEIQAVVATERHQWDEAEAFFKKLEQLRPEQDFPKWRQGHVQLLRGNTKAAIETMSAACADNADLPSPELTAALHFAGMNETAQAEDWFKAAIRKNSNDSVRWHEYLKWLILNDRAGDASKLLAKVPEKAKSSRNVQTIEGFVARIEGDLTKAEQIFSQLTQANANDAEAADQLALVLIESADEGKRGRALQLSELNLRRANSVQSVIATAAWVQFKLGAIDVADRLLGQLAQQTSLQPQTAYYVAKVLEAKGQAADAKRVMQAAIDTPGMFVERAKVKAALAANP